MSLPDEDGSRGRFARGDALLDTDEMQHPAHDHPRPGRPRLDPARRRQKLVLSLPPAQTRWIREQAAAKRTSISDFMQHVILCEIARMQRLAPKESAADVLARLVSGSASPRRDAAPPTTTIPE